MTTKSKNKFFGFIIKHKILSFIILGIIFLIFLWFLVLVLFIENEDVYSSAPLNTKWLDVGVNRVAYQHHQSNSSNTLVFVGGTTAWSGVWEYTIDDLEGDYNIYTIDLPPFGYSVVDKMHKYNLISQAGIINGFLEELNLQNVTLIAHSYGAGPSTEAVLSEKERYEKYVIIDGTVYVDRERNSSSIIKTIFSFSPFRYFITSVAIHFPGFMKGSLEYLVFDNSKVDDFWVGIYTQPLTLVGQSDRLSNWLFDFVFENGEGISSKGKNYKDLDIPVLIIWGGEDNFTPIEQGLTLQRIIPNNELVVMDNVGHIPMIDDHEGYISVLKEFL
jgi:pimeloyl-ACP methyl ester carboxylesterase